MELTLTCIGCRRVSCRSSSKKFHLRCIPSDARALLVGQVGVEPTPKEAGFGHFHLLFGKQSCCNFHEAILSARLIISSRIYALGPPVLYTNPSNPIDLVGIGARFCEGTKVA